MIARFRHKGLQRLYEHGDGRKLHADQLGRIRDMLFHLDEAERPSDLDLPGYRLHPLTGKRKRLWSMRVSGNWRIVFRFEDGNAFDVDLVDYH